MNATLLMFALRCFRHGRYGVLRAWQRNAGAAYYDAYDAVWCCRRAFTLPLWQHSALPRRPALPACSSEGHIRVDFTARRMEQEPSTDREPMPAEPAYQYVYLRSATRSIEGRACAEARRVPSSAMYE